MHEPGATFVTSARSLADIIDWMNANVTDPVGVIYIVSHANEDGTLSFGVDSSDQDHHMDYGELRDALGGGGRSLPRLQHNQADNAIVHIKGCDIGRTPAMLDLIGKAFGGHVAVYAPTHEQVYGYDPWIADQARRQTESLIRSDAERRNPEPPPVDPRLTGAARVAAVRERERLMAARRRKIDAEHFRATRLVSVNRTTQGDKAVVTVEVEGRFSPPGEPASTGKMTLTSETPSDALIIKEGRERTGNAERYAWDLDETPGRAGLVQRAARGRRVRGYLHHQSLDASAHAHFQIEAGNLDYFGTNGLPPRTMVKAP